MHACHPAALVCHLMPPCRFCDGGTSAAGVSEMTSGLIGHQDTEATGVGEPLHGGLEPLAGEGGVARREAVIVARASDAP